MDTKIAADSVFSALGKPLPERAPPEGKTAPSAKGKKPKDSKKGTLAASLQIASSKHFFFLFRRTIAGDGG